MQMFEEDGKFIFELNELKSNEFFEPFDPQNKGLSLVDFRDHYRFAREEFRGWMDVMVGRKGVAWNNATYDLEGDLQEISFREKKHAMAFKLVWG